MEEPAAEGELHVLVRRGLAVPLEPLLERLEPLVLVPAEQLLAAVEGGRRRRPGLPAADPRGRRLVAVLPPLRVGPEAAILLIDPRPPGQGVEVPLGLDLRADERRPVGRGCVPALVQPVGVREPHGILFRVGNDGCQERPLLVGLLPHALLPFVRGRLTRSPGLARRPAAAGPPAAGGTARCGTRRCSTSPECT